MAGRIILLDDFTRQPDGTESVSALFVFELAVGELKKINGVNAKPTTAAALLAQYPLLLQHNIIDAGDLAKFDTGDWDFRTKRLIRYPGESLTAIADKMKTEYVRMRAEYITEYTLRYTFAGVDIPL